MRGMVKRGPIDDGLDVAQLPVDQRAVTIDIVHRSDTAIDFLVGELLMEQKSEQVLAPELQVSRWFNTKEPLTLAALRGHPILLHTFQMLCPGCVAHAIPQAQKIHGMLRNTDQIGRA